MNKKLSNLFTFFCLFSFSLAFAKQIPISDATKIAQTHMSQTSLVRTGIVKLVKTETGITNLRNLQNLFYIFNIGNNNGFIIVAADDVCTPIIGYTSSGSYNETNLPINYIEWMQLVKKGIENAILQRKEPTYEVKKQWENYLKGNALSLRSSKSVDPLIKTQWNQGAPYNNTIPIPTNEDNNSVLTGCVATTMAQIIKYHEFPKKGYKIIPKYTSYSLKKTIPTIDITQYTYDWDNMVNIYGKNGNNPIQNKAVADLMYHCGAAVNMDYNYGGSGAYSSDVPYALTYFGYTTSGMIQRSNYSDEDWINIIKSSIDKKLPIYYSGRTNSSGHAFICDGYDTQGMIHFNWGWGGYMDGYFSIDAPLDYKLDHQLIHNIKPNASSLYDKNEKEFLRKFLRQGNNFTTLGLTVSDTLKWRSTEDWIPKIKGLTWTNTTENKKLTKIYWWNLQTLSGNLIVNEFEEINEISLPFNKLTELTITNNQKLKTIDAGYNELTNISIDNCPVLKTLLVHINKLNNLNVQNYNTLETFFCYNNSLKFSDFPTQKNLSIKYYSQRRTEGGTVIRGKIIDLSKEYNIDGKITNFKWYNSNGQEISLTSTASGKFIADAKYNENTLICKMTNERFPNLTIEYAVTIKAPIYNQDDKDALINFLSQGDNLSILGLTTQDKFNWENSEEWISKVKGLTWRNFNGSKRLVRIFWWNVGKLIGTLDLTQFKEINEVICPFHQLNEIKALNNTKLETIDAGYNKLTNISIENCRVLSTLKVHNNNLNNLNIKNYNTFYTFFCNGNNLKFSDFPINLITNIDFSNQKRIEGGYIISEEIIDLSKEYNIDGKITNFKWFTEKGTEISLSSVGNGKFYADGKYSNETLICKMTNERFPDITIEYAINIKPSIYNQEEKEALKQFLNQGNNYITAGLTDEDKSNWSSSEEWISKVKGLTWENINGSKRLVKINWWSFRDLTGALILTPFTEIEEVLCPFNQLAEISALNNPKLKHIDAGYNKLTNISIDNCPVLNILKVHNNNLNNLNIKNYNSLNTFFCSSNNLKFSDFPVNKITNTDFSNQSKIIGGTIASGEIIDFSKEYNIDGSITNFNWFTENGEKANLTSAGNGKFFADAFYNELNLTCKMTNERFPNLTIIYTVNFKGHLPYDKNEIKALTEFLNQGNNYITAGLTDEDKSNWNSSEEWISKVKGLTWENINGSKRLVKINWWSFRNLTGALVLTPFTEIEEVLCPFNQLAEIIALNNPKLKHIDAGYNKLTNISVDNCPVLNTLLVHINNLDNLNIKNYNSINTFFCYNNNLKFSDFPINKITNSNFSNQKSIDGGTIASEEIIDFSKEYNIDGKITNFSWFTKNGEKINLTSAGNGKFFADEKYNNQTLICKMTNERFPNSTIEFIIKISATRSLLMNQNQQVQVQVYPNPATNILNININEEILSVDIYRTSGKQIKQIEQVQNNQINVHSLPPGVYILIIKTANKQFSTKFTKN